MYIVTDNEHEEELVKIATRHVTLINAFMRIVAGASLLVGSNRSSWCMDYLNGRQIRLT